MKALTIQSKGVSDRSLDKLIENLPQLQSISLLGNTDISDAGIRNLKRLTNLQSLDLRSANISDTGLEHLKGLSRLQNLILPFHVTEAGVDRLKELHNWNRSISGTRMSAMPD